MAGSIFGFPLRPTTGQGVIWQETLGGRMDTGALGQAASGLSGLTLNRVPFGNSLGGLQDSGNLTFDGTTLVLTGAATISSTLGVSGQATVKSNASSAAILTVGSLNDLAVATQVGIYSNLTGTTSGTTSVRGFQADVRTTAAAYTLTDAIGFLGGSGAIGSGSSVTNYSAFHASAGLAATNRAALTQSASATLPVFSGTYFLYNGTSSASYMGTGDVSFGGAVQLGNAYVGTPPACTGYVTIKDSTGTTYKVLVAT